MTKDLCVHFTAFFQQRRTHYPSHLSLHCTTTLQKQLAELQSESSHVQKGMEHSAVLAKVIAATNIRRNAGSVLGTRSVAETSNHQTNLDDIKQKFRLGAAERMNRDVPPPQPPSRSSAKGTKTTTRPDNRRNVQSSAHRLLPESRSRLTGEMFQYLDFYKRSLEAVESSQRSASGLEYDS